MNKTATLLQDNLVGFKGHAAFYKLSPPFESIDYDYNDYCIWLKHEYVVVSATFAFDHGGPETFIFPADAKGKMTSWGELPGSQRDTLDHDYVLNQLGYQVVKA